MTFKEMTMNEANDIFQRGIAADITSVEYGAVKMVDSLPKEKNIAVYIDFNNHRSSGQDCGSFEVYEDAVYQEAGSFEMIAWKAFRVGAGRGAKATQKDFQAFVKFHKDQGHAQYKETFTNAKAWRAMIERCYY